MTQTNQGPILRYHLNSNSSRGRGVAITMNPGLPGTGWACVWTDNPLYEEITAMLLQAKVAGKDVRIQWDANRGGHIDIDVAEIPA